MNTSPRISYLAITSFVLGMAFYVPIIAGVLAVAFGIWAVRIIRRSNGALLGKGLAISGATLGFGHAAFWALVFFAGLSYTVEVGQTAVISRNGQPNRTEGLGKHYKIPFLEHAEFFPTAALFSTKESAVTILFKSRHSAELDYNVLWKICEPLNTFTTMGPFDKSIIELRLSSLASNILRGAAIESNNETDWSADLTFNQRIEKQLESEMKDLGVCVKAFTVNKKGS